MAPYVCRKRLRKKDKLIRGRIVKYVSARLLAMVELVLSILIPIQRE
jgi:hypothetical protein